MKTGGSKHVRCAIYTRVSTDQGLEQDFNSLDAQYDASQAYIRSQAHAGWTPVRSKYDDGGFGSRICSYSPAPFNVFSVVPARTSCRRRLTLRSASSVWRAGKA